MRNPLKIELYQDQANEWRVRLSRSGRIIMVSSEGYGSEQKARQSWFGVLKAVQKDQLCYTSWR